jgi:hypothetical protein
MDLVLEFVAAYVLLMAGMFRVPIRILLFYIGIAAGVLILSLVLGGVLEVIGELVAAFALFAGYYAVLKSSPAETAAGTSFNKRN